MKSIEIGEKHPELKVKTQKDTREMSILLVSQVSKLLKSITTTNSTLQIYSLKELIVRKLR